MVVRGEFLTPAAIPLGKKPKFIEYEAEWASESLWTFGEEENSFPCRDSNSELSSV